MPQEIVSQSDYYGLPQPERAPAPAPEKVAELLKAPTPWEGPMSRQAVKEGWQDGVESEENPDGVYLRPPLKDNPNHRDRHEDGQGNHLYVQPNEFAPDGWTPESGDDA